MDLSSTYDAAGQAFNVDPALLQAVSQAESGGNPNAVSPAGAIGHMQIMPATAQAVGVDPRDPVQSVWGAANLLSQNLVAAKGDVPTALRMYNAGPDRSRWNNPETQAYVGRVAAAYRPAQQQASAFGQAGGDEVPLAASSQDQQNAVDPVNAAAPASAGTPDLSAMDKLWGVSTPASSSKAASSAPPPAAANDTAAMDKLWGIGSTSNQPPATGSEPGNTTQPVAPQGFFSRLSAGAARGMDDVRDTATDAAAYVDKAVPALSNLDASVLGQTPQQMQPGQAAQRQAFNQNYGNSLVASVGRVAGNALATAPATVATGGLLNPLTGAAVDAVGSGVLGLGARVAGGALTGAAEGAGAGAATSTGYGENPLAAAKTGAEFGGALGGAGAVLGRFVPGTVTNALTGTAPPVRAQLADTAVNGYGIPLTAAQVTGDQGSRRLAQAATTMGGGDAKLATQQQAAFNQAVLKTVGVDAPAATQQVMAQAKTQIGKQMDAVLAQAPPIKADNQFLSDLGSIENSMQGVPDSQADAVRRLIDNVRSSANQNQEITPELYQTLIQHKSPLARAMASDDGTLSGAAGEIKDVLDDGFSRSLAGAGQSDLLDQWQQARFQYKNLKTIEPIVNKSPSGDISPALLQGRVNVQFGNRAYTGAGDLGQLADIGQSFLKPLSSSGTPEQGFGLYNLVEGSRAGTQLLHGDVGGAAATAGAMLARPVLAKTANALVGSPALGKAIIARSLGQPSPLNNALVVGSVAAPAVVTGGAVPALNMLLQRQTAP
jgi:hypothetical protein